MSGSLIALVVILTTLLLLLSLWTILKAQAAFAPCGRLDLLLVALIGGVVFYTSPEHAAQFGVSDGIEYSVAAQRLLYDGSYSIEVNSVAHPPRYSPAFSALIVLPGYLLFGSHIGNGIFLVTVLSVLALMAVYLLACAVSNRIGGVLAVVLVIAISSYRYFGGQIMTDLPSVAIAAFCALLVLLLAGQRVSRLSGLGAAGVLIGFGLVLRPTNIFLIFPFLPLLFQREFRDRFPVDFALLTAPVIFGGLWTLKWNLATFGYPLRSGYHYWTAVPYDYSWLTFSSNYISQNFADASTLLQAAGLLVLLLVITRNVSKDHALEIDWGRVKSGSLFFVLFALPLVAFYLVYFYGSPRFYLAPLLLAVAFGGGVAGSLTRLKFETVPHKLPLVALVVVLLLSGAYRVAAFGSKDEAHVLSFVRTVRDVLPRNGVLVTDVNLVLVEHLARTSRDQRFLPFSRETEYASKVIIPQRIPIPPGKEVGPYEHRAEFLLAGGARDPFTWVVSDSPERLRKLAQMGRQIFLDGAVLDGERAGALEQYFTVQGVGVFLKRLVPKEATTDS